MTGEHHDAAARGGARAVVARWMQTVRDVPRWVWVAAAALVALCLTVIAMGGLAAAQASPQTLAAGDEARTAVYSITVLDAEFTDEVESEFLQADAGEKLLVMTTLIENLSSEAIGVGTTADRIKSGLINTENPLLDLNDVAETGSTAAWRADGSAGQVILQPGVPSEVTLAWTVPEEAFADGVVSLDVHDADIRRGAVILSSSVVTWRAADVTARISVTAKDAR